jgi:SAM-dependent methyltransferase
MIEHLNDDYMTKAVNEFHRILKPDGVLVLTTPNNEDLSVGEVLCAECGARFHRMQHVRSWTADALREEMEGSGFETIRCRSVYFTQPTAASHLKAVAYRLGGLKTPNLLYFGRRRPSK